MIILKKLNLINFLSHKETILTFNDTIKLGIEGKSGSGKSSIIEGIIWGLYGEARVENRNLVKHGEKSGSVTITLYDNNEGIFYEIKRSTTDKAKNTLTASESEDGEDFKPIQRTGLRDIQDWIEKELLHASYQLFINSIAYPQDGSNSFVKQNAAKRKDLLLEIANVDDFDLYYNRARDLFTLKNEEKIRIKSSTETSLSFIEKQKESIIDEKSIQSHVLDTESSISIAAKKLEDVLVQKKIINDSKQVIIDIQENITLNKERYQELSEQLNKKLSAIDLIKAINIQSIKDKMAKGEILKASKIILEEKRDKDYERTNKLNSIMADKPFQRDYDAEIMDLNKRLIPLIKETGKCPSGDLCPFVVPIQNQIIFLGDQINEKIAGKLKLENDKEFYAAKIEALGPPIFTQDDQAELGRLISEFMVYDDCKSMLASAETQQASLPTLESEYSEMGFRLVSLGAGLDKLLSDLKNKTEMQTIVDTTGLDEEERKIRGDISGLELIKKDMNNKLLISQEANKRIYEINKNIKVEQDTLLVVEASLESISAIKEAFGAKGLRTIVIDFLIPRLEEKINEILSKLSDFRVQLDTQKGTADGEGTIEGLFINIFNERGEQFSFESYSGGERLKITVAISEALASLQKCGFRIFDELFIGLDEESVEHFAEVVDQLQDKFKQMLCISHLRTIKDLFSDKITITKINGNSQIQ